MCGLGSTLCSPGNTMTIIKVVLRPKVDYQGEERKLSKSG
jgi:hypothetical protein